MTPEDFIAWLAPAAQTQTKAYDLPASVLIAQGALESGWGENIIGQFNLFGRKWNGTGSYIEKVTQECYHDERQIITTKFQDYDNLLQACDDWCILMTQEPAYADAYGIWCSTHNVEQFVCAMATVYATDPNYTDKLLAIIGANDLMTYYV